MTTTTTMQMPDLGEGIVEAEIVGWLVAEGDHVTTETPIADVQTDKATVELMAPVDGVVAALLVEAGALVAVGTAIVTITAEASLDPSVATRATDHSASEAMATPTALRPTVGPPPRSASPAAPTAPAATPNPTTRDRPAAAPTVRQLARELGVDLRCVNGTGPSGRILQSDVESHLASGPRAAPAARRPDEVEQIRGLRRTISHRLAEAWTAPHITLVDDVDVTELEALRASLKDELAGQGVRLTPLTFVARALVIACADHPACNATFDPGAETLTRHGAVHLGIATRTGRGLIVPVVRDADQLSLSNTARGIHHVATLARDGTASREQLRGSTITVTSLGALGGIMNTPILNAPEVAIIGVNRMRTEPVWDGTTFAPRTVLHLSASFDHRVIDGWDAAIFLQRIKELLEHPGQLTLGWER